MGVAFSMQRREKKCKPYRKRPHKDLGVDRKIIVYYKKFWEELIAYFL
jgi:hypothetical protein